MGINESQQRYPFLHRPYQKSYSYRQAARLLLPASAFHQQNILMELMPLAQFIWHCALSPLTAALISSSDIWEKRKYCSRSSADLNSCVAIKFFITNFLELLLTDTLYYCDYSTIKKLLFCYNPISKSVYISPIA